MKVRRVLWCNLVKVCVVCIVAGMDVRLSHTQAPLFDSNCQVSARLGIHSFHLSALSRSQFYPQIVPQPLQTFQVTIGQIFAEFCDAKWGVCLV